MSYFVLFFCILLLVIYMEAEVDHYLGWGREGSFVCYCLPCNYEVSVGEDSSSSGCLGWAILFYCGTP